MNMASYPLLEKLETNHTYIWFIGKKLTIHSSYMLDTFEPNKVI